MPQSHSGALLGSSRQPFRRSLLSWYDAHARDLPWRSTHDPYHVWLSEIMLQQTRVAAVIDHYHEFLRRFPTIEKLAAAREAGVLAAWSGLGYYRRARMLHAAAKVIVRQHGGKFPSTAEQLRNLPGIGRYTSAAIASIAFDEPVAVVDGNVERVLQRISGKRVTGEALWKTAETLLDHSRPGDFNQAMMELGAVLCTPRAPQCLSCPVIAHCATRGELPAATPSTPQKKREVHYLLDCRNAKVFMVRRPTDASLMPGMWELPEWRVKNSSRLPHLTLRHSVTVTDYTIKVFLRKISADLPGRWIAFDRLGHIALTGLARKILRRAGLLLQLDHRHPEVHLSS